MNEHECRGRARSRGGFTLVELLVVIGIIAMVSAIAVPTIFGAVASARNAKTKSEVDMLHVALMNYKSEYGSFPPANMNGLWTGSGVNKGHAAYKHLVKIFPRINENATASGPFPHMATMSPAQALVFWLGGFYQNPENPITNGNPAWPAADPSGATGGSRQKFFDFDESRLYAATTYLFNGTAQEFAPRGSPAATPMTVFPVYFTGHPSAGLPYAYFDSRCYSTGSDISYTAKSLMSGENSTAWPYMNATPPLNPTPSQLRMNADTFQLIAPGKDGDYGSAQAAFPAAVGGFPAASASAGHLDNITNFADRPLADAIEALKAQK